MDSSLRICLISKQFPPGVGGAETYAYELANGLADRGHKVDVYTQWVDNPNEEADVHQNVSVHRICKARRKLVTFETLWFSLTARRKIDFETYDIVHGTMMPASTIATTLFKNIQTPIILTSHGTSIGETKAVALETPADYLLKYFFHPMNIVMDYIASRDADRVIAISDHAYKQLTMQFHLNEDEVEMIPHGVDTERFYPRKEEHPVVNEGKTTLLYVGRLGARKGLDLIFQALAEINDEDIEFLIAGTGRHEWTLRELGQELGVANQVRFVGYVADAELPILYSSADVFVLPSKYEGFGLVLLEAMACGTPVIGADAGGIPTVIEDDTGLVVSRTVEDFVGAIELISNNESFRTEYAEKSYTKTKNMSWQSVARAVEDINRELIHSKT